MLRRKFGCELYSSSKCRKGPTAAPCRGQRPSFEVSVNALGASRLPQDLQSHLRCFAVLSSEVRSSGGLEVALGSCLHPELPEVAMDQGHTIHQVSQMRHIGCIGYIGLVGFMPEISLQLLSPGT